MNYAAFSGGYWAVFRNEIKLLSMLIRALCVPDVSQALGTRNRLWNDRTARLACVMYMHFCRHTREDQKDSLITGEHWMEVIFGDLCFLFFLFYFFLSFFPFSLILGIGTQGFPHAKHSLPLN